MKKKRDELLNGSIFKLFIKYFIPTLIGSIVIVLYNIVDRYFVGKISEEALAGAGVSFYIIMIFIAFAMLIGVGSGTIVSLYLGNKKRKKSEKVLGNAVTIFFIIGIILFIVLKLNLDSILWLSGANEETLPHAKKYLEIVLYAIFPLFYSYGLTNVLNGAGMPRIAMFALVLGAGTNIVLDYVTVVVLKMGIEGTAYATLIGNILSAIIVLYFLIMGRFPIKINLFGYKLEEVSTIRLRKNNLKLDMEIVKDMFSVGISPFLLQCVGSLVGLITNKIVELNGGTSGVAIVTIINSYLPIMTMSVYSVSQAIQPIIGFNYGANNYLRVRKSLYISIFMGMLLSAIFWSMVMIVPKEMIEFFNSKGDEIGIIEGIKALRIYFSTVILSSLGIIIPNYYQATGRPKYGVILNLLRQLVLFLIAVIIFTRIWYLDGVWYSQVFTDIVFAILLIFFVLFEIKSLKKKEMNK